LNLISTASVSLAHIWFNLISVHQFLHARYYENKLYCDIPGKVINYGLNYPRTSGAQQSNHLVFQLHFISVCSNICRLDDGGFSQQDVSLNWKEWLKSQCNFLPSVHQVSLLRNKNDRNMKLVTWFHFKFMLKYGCNINFMSTHLHDVILAHNSIFLQGISLL
jgi:hypothetical protein